MIIGIQKQKLKSIDFDLWKVIQNRYNIPTKIENEVSIPKLIHE